MQKIKIKVLNNNVQLPDIIHKGDWIDLEAAEEIFIKAPQAGTLKKSEINGVKESHRDVSFGYVLINLGIAVCLPEGFEAVILPRSSTYKNFGIIPVNCQGVIDNSYCGNNDEWKFPVIALRDTIINPGDRICQFRIQLSQKATIWQKIKWLFSSEIKIVEVRSLNEENRGGFGSTGINWNENEIV